MDRYTKAVLTVIAASLAVIAFKLPLTSSASALGDGCGDSSYSPCYITSGDRYGLDVYVKNWP